MALAMMGLEEIGCIFLEMWLKLSQTKNKLIPTWIQEEKELNPAWRQKETGQDTTWIQGKMVQKISPHRGDEGKSKINEQVVCGYSLQIKDRTT